MLLRTAPRRRPSRLGQYRQKTFVDVFNTYSNIYRQRWPKTASTITFFCLASAAPQSDSWWLGHVEPDDVVIADIVGQALDIFLHGPESAIKNGIVKTFTRTSIHTPQRRGKKKKKLRAKCWTRETWCLRLLILFLSSVMVVDFEEAWRLLQFGGLVA